MLSFNEAQVLAWITPLLWPFLRALALFTALPVFGQRGVPARVRVGLAAFIALAAQPSLPPLDAAAQVALEAGNSPDIIFKHYRELVTEEAAADWFSIRPPENWSPPPLSLRRLRLKRRVSN